MYIYGTEWDFYVHLHHPWAGPGKLAHLSVFSITTHEARMVQIKNIRDVKYHMLQLNDTEAKRYVEELTLVWTYSVFRMDEHVYH